MRLFLDVTRLRQRGKRSTPSGIDRVEFAYLDHVLDSAPDKDIHFVAFHGLGEGLVRPERARALRDAVAAAWRIDVGAEGDSCWRSLKAALESPPPLALSAAARIEGAAPAGRWSDGAGLPARDMLRARTRLARRLLAAGPEAVYLHTSHSQLDRPALPRWLEGAQVQPVFFLHDVIPIDTPEFCRPGEDVRHRLRIAAMSRHARLVLVNSEATADAARDCMTREGWRIPPFAVVPLGVENCFRRRETLDPPRATHPYFVVVGTIEPRKNLAFLFEVWRGLVGRAGAAAPRLVVVGRRGWENEGVIDYLERSGRLAPFIVEVSDLSDAGLAAVMAGARAVLAPSLAEGFSLPVAEGLALGAPVICSDIPVHREIARGCATLVDPIDGPGWIRAIEAACSGRAPASPGPYPALSWREHVETALGLIAEHARMPQGAGGRRGA
jgi:glycosyltransferase involved in cell wall biosynthesis